MVRLSRHWPAFCLLLLAVLAPGIATRAAASAAPGRSVGHVFLGMARADVWKILGKPKRTFAVPHGMDLYGEDDWTGDGHTLTVVSRRDKVVQVEFDSPHLATTDRLSTQKSTFAQVRRRHPVMTVRVRLSRFFQFQDEKTGNDYYLDDVPGGIAFTCGFDLDLASNSQKRSLFFTEVTPDTIIIHPPGVAVVPVYNGRWAASGENPGILPLMRSWFTPAGAHH